MAASANPPSVRYEGIMSYSLDNHYDCVDSTSEIFSFSLSSLRECGIKTPTEIGIVCWTYEVVNDVTLAQQSLMVVCYSRIKNKSPTMC